MVWNITTFEKRIELIIQLLEKEQNKETLELLKYDLNALKNYIEYCNITDKKQPMSLLKSYEILKFDYSSISYLWQEFQKHYSLSIKPINIPPLKSASLSQSNLFEITHDFFKSLNNSYYQCFMHYYKKRKEHVNFVFDENPFSNEGLTYILPSLKESFIEINRTYTIEDSLRLIHEYSHSISSLMNPYQMRYPKKIYSEIDSIFMEMIATDYLKCCTTEENISILNMDRIKNFYYISKDINNIINLINAEKKQNQDFNKNKILKEIALKECDINNNELEDLLKYPDLYSTIYLISYIFAIELYYIYLEDKELALHILKKIILINENNDEKIFKDIKKLGLIPNKNFAKYQKECKQKYNELSRKRSKL